MVMQHLESPPPAADPFALDWHDNARFQHNANPRGTAVFRPAALDRAKRIPGADGVAALARYRHVRSARSPAHTARCPNPARARRRRAGIAQRCLYRLRGPADRALAETRLARARLSAPGLRRQ